MTSNKKSRYWAFVFYPESAPSNWLAILQATLLPIAVSPLHDADKNADEEQKKPHYHVLIPFGNTTTSANAQAISDSINGTIVIPVLSVKGMYRYHCHLDNPEKTPYKEKYRVLINGFNIEDYVSLSRAELMQMKVRIIEFIEKEGITEYRDLLYKLMGEDIELFEFCSNHTLLFNTYVTSRRNGIKAFLDK